ncbi:MAG: response regulator [Anaerolineae bacterium]|nr:response regulator [Anaerolineae bacterium]
MSYTILYVEDEPAIIELVHDCLEHPDIDLISASCAAEGIQKARESKPHLMMLDVLMPDRSGWSIYNEVRSDPAFKDMPIIMLTGQLHRYRIMKEFSHSAIDAYITKPFDVNTVRLEIEKMLGIPIWSGYHETTGRPGGTASRTTRQAIEGRDHNLPT